MKRIVTLLVAFVMVLALFGGCTDNGAEDAATDTNDGTQEDSSVDEGDAADSDATSEDDSGEKKYLKMQLPLNDTLSGIKPVTVSGYGTLAQMIFGTLMRYNLETASYVPALAEGVDISDDGLVYTVTLKDDMYFHDGTPITADDIVFTYNNTISGGGIRSNKLSTIKGYTEVVNGEADTVSGIEKIDDKTVSFTLIQQNSLFMEAFANGSFSILPSHILGEMSYTEVAEYSDFWAQPVGSGAYEVTETAYPNYIVLTAFEEYYDPSGIENVLCTYYADDESLQAALIAGDLALYRGMDEEAADNAVAQNPDLVKTVSDSTYRRWFMVNCSDTAGDNATHPSMGNARVRQAINMLLDKNAICALFGDIATPLTSVINPGLAEYNTDLPTWERDVEGAKAILAEEDFDFDTPIRIFANYTDQKTVDFCELVVQNLAEGGVAAEYTIDGNWQPYLSVQDYDFRYAGGMSYAVIDFYSYATTTGLGAYTAGNFNTDDPEWVAYWQPRYDELVNAYLATIDPVEQKEIIDQLQFNAYEDMFDIPLYALNNVDVHNTAMWTGYPVFARDYEEIIDRNFSDWELLE